MNLFSASVKTILSKFAAATGKVGFVSYYRDRAREATAVVDRGAFRSHVHMIPLDCRDSRIS